MLTRTLQHVPPDLRFDSSYIICAQMPLIQTRNCAFVAVTIQMSCPGTTTGADADPMRVLKVNRRP